MYKQWEVFVVYVLIKNVLLKYTILLTILIFYAPCHSYSFFEHTSVHEEHWKWRIHWLWRITGWRNTSTPAAANIFCLFCKHWENGKMIYLFDRWYFLSLSFWDTLTVVTELDPDNLILSSMIFPFFAFFSNIGMELVHVKWARCKFMYKFLSQLFVMCVWARACVFNTVPLFRASTVRIGCKTIFTPLTGAWHINGLLIHKTYGMHLIISNKLFEDPKK